VSRWHIADTVIGGDRFESESHAGDFIVRDEWRLVTLL